MPNCQPKCCPPQNCCPPMSCPPCGPYPPMCGPCGPCPPCGPCAPSPNVCFPRVPANKNDCGPKCLTAQDLCSMPQCPDVCPPQKCGPQFVKIQQPPRVVCQKKVIYSKRTVIDKHVVPETREICEPKLVYQPRVICEPVVVYKKRIVPEPRIVYVKRCVPDPKVVCQPRTIVEPREICQTMVCQPKPQVIQIPQPQEYIVAPTGTSFVNNKNCPPCPILPLGKQCNPAPVRDFNCCP